MRRCAVIAPYRSRGGVTSAFFTSLELVRRAGFVPVAVADRQALFLDQLRDCGVELHTIPRLARRGAVGAFLVRRRLARLVRRLKPDLVLAHNGRFIRGLKQTCPRVPVVGVVHSGKARRFLAADRLIAVNEEQRADLIALGYPAARVTRLDNVLPVDEVPPFAVRPWHTLPAIGTLRILEPAKGVDVLIAAAALLQARGVAFTLHIGGAGSEEAALGRMIAEAGLAGRVHTHGWVSPQAPFLETLDLYVLPSRHETFGIAILEAQAAGLPVIASACEGPRSIIEDGVTGLLVPPGDAAALADAIAALLADRRKAARLARAGHADCARRFVLPALVEPYGAVLRQALLS